jgi:acyl-homoserine lactone acylase PvdQ
VTRGPAAQALACAVLCAAPALAGEVTIYRDRWGVPHVFGATREDAAFGHGWAQAEDRLEDLLRAHLLASGRAAAVLGEPALEADRLAHTARHDAIARERYGELGEETRRLIEAFVAGVAAYMREHPDRVPAWGAPPEAHGVVAVYRAFAWAWPWGQARGDLERRGSQVEDGRGSNAWVVGASRSAEAAPLLLIDPHLSWDPVSRLYEAHVHGGDLHFYGFSVPGTPVMALGHTDVLAWALTTGGPDCADVYEERIHPQDPLRYEFDGAWHAVEVEQIALPVRAADGSTRIETLRVERTRHGPIVARSDGRAFAVRTAYDREVGLVEQWLDMARSRNLGEFLQAMRANQALPQNVLYADVHGNLYYLRAGRVPRRPLGFAWDRPVPGWTSATEWSGIHPLADLVQVLNPPGGMMQNCNVSPAAMFPGSPLTSDRYPAELYNDRGEPSNSRGRRVLELLGARRPLALDDALRVAVDTRVEGVERWQAALRHALDKRQAPPARLAEAAELILGWDGFVEPDRRAAPLYRLWMRECLARDSGVGRARIERGELPENGEAAALVAALERAAEALLAARGRLDVAWGDLHRVRRGDRSWPVGGLRADGISTLRSVRYGAPGADGVSDASGGQLCTTVVLLREGAVTSYSATPWGQSDDPASPHWADQAERLFSRGLLKPTWYGKDDLLQHVQSQRTLTTPGSDPVPY